MEGIENQEVTNYRDELVNRMKSRYPDRNFDGAEGGEGVSSLEQTIIELLNENDTRINDLSEQNKVYEENTSKLTSMVANSPRAAVFINTLATTGDPSAAVYKAYGKDAYDAFNDGNASEFIASIEAEDAKNRAENDKLEAEKAENLKASFAALDEWGNSKGLDDEQKAQVWMRFYDILSDALMGKYSTDLFEMGWKADNYDNDVASARKEGEVAGRNANIKAQSARRNSNAALPPTLSGQGIRANETRAAKPKTEGDFWTE